MFTNEYRIINLKYEYEGYTGTEKWAIITSLSEKELLEKYADILESHSPYILLTIEQGNAIDEYQRNEAKHRMRSLRCGHAFDITDGEFEVHHPELAVCEDIVEQIDKEDKIKRLRDLSLIHIQMCIRDRAYVSYTGIVRRIDDYEHTLIMTDKTVIPIEQISEIESELFGEMGIYEQQEGVSNGNKTENFISAEGIAGKN